MPKFDYIIQNPPYAKSLHIKFFNKGLDILNDKGRMVIIEPATWLINIRKDGKSKSEYSPLKNRLINIVDRVSIQNLNYVFGTCMFVPFSITYVNKSKSDNKIIFDNFNIRQEVYSLYDCNFIGKYDMIWSILSKVKVVFKNDMLFNHIEHPQINEHYFRYANILASLVDTLHSTSECFWINDYYEIYYTPCIHKSDLLSNEIKVINHKTNKTFIVGSKKELENFKRFVLQSKLSKFINICMCIDMHNNSLKYIPWCVDFTNDNELFNRLKLSDEEITLVNDTVSRFKRDNDYCKAMIYGI